MKSCCVNNLDARIGAESQLFGYRKMHQLVLAGATREMVGVLAARSFNHDFLNTSDAGAMLLHGRAVQHHFQTVVALAHLSWVTKLVHHCGCGGAFAR